CDGKDGQVPPPLIKVLVPFAFSSSSATATKFTHLKVSGVPAGATVTVTCLTRSCPATLLHKRQQLAILVTKKGSAGAVEPITINERKSPTIATRCLKPGAKKPTAHC